MWILKKYAGTHITDTRTDIGTDKANIYPADRVPESHYSYPTR